jgi:tetratricopeptide (TPR) repeat protein
MSQESMLRPFLQLLNREADAGQTAMQTLREKPVTAWAPYFAVRPGWWSYGVFRALLAYAREMLDGDKRLALAITTFVIERVHDLDVIPDSVILGPFIRGLAWKEHANAHYMLGQYDLAGAAAERAIAIFSGTPALAIDVAWATLIRAMSMHNLGKTREALDLIIKTARLFGKHAEPRGYRVALAVCGGILVDLEEYAAARDAISLARTLAEEQNEPREVARMLNNIGQCSVKLGEFELGEAQLQQASRLLSEQHMDSEITRTVIGLARSLHKRGLLEAAIAAFQNVYVDFLHYGMVIPAAQVLVELTDVVTELTGDVEWARAESAKLAASFGDYDVPGNVRAAMAYMQRETAAAGSVDQVRAALDYVRKFLQDLFASPSTAFAVPA